MRHYQNMTEVKRAHADTAGYFFHRDTMRCWESKIETPLCSGHYFITSERAPNGHTQNASGRCFTVRVVLSNAAVRTVGGLDRYPALEDASAAMWDYINAGAGIVEFFGFTWGM